MTAAKVAHDNAPLCVLTIPGRPKVLKNSKRIFGGGPGRKRIVLPSSAYTKWEQNAMTALRARLKAKPVALIDFEVAVVMRFYFANRQSQSDLSNLTEGPADVLQKANVLADDKLIRDLRTTNHFGHEPRTEIEIYAFEETPE